GDRLEQFPLARLHRPGVDVVDVRHPLLFVQVEVFSTRIRPARPSPRCGVETDVVVGVQHNPAIVVGDAALHLKSPFTPPPAGWFGRRRVNTGNLMRWPMVLSRTRTRAPAARHRPPGRDTILSVIVLSIS